MLDAYIYDGLRTPFGRHAGALAPVRPDDLLADVIRALIARNPFDPALIEDVVAGNTNRAAGVRGRPHCQPPVRFRPRRHPGRGAHGHRR